MECDSFDAVRFHYFGVGCAASCSIVVFITCSAYGTDLATTVYPTTPPWQLW